MYLISFHFNSSSMIFFFHFQVMAVRIVDVVALALVLLCGLCAAYNSMDLAELLRGRQRLAEQKRAMDGTSFPLHILLLHLQVAPVQSIRETVSMSKQSFWSFFSMSLETFWKIKCLSETRITRRNGQFTEYSLQNRPWVILFYFNGNRSLRRDFDDKLETN